MLSAVLEKLPPKFVGEAILARPPPLLLEPDWSASKAAMQGNERKKKPKRADGDNSQCDGAMHGGPERILELLLDISLGGRTTDAVCNHGEGGGRREGDQDNCEGAARCLSEIVRKLRVGRGGADGAWSLEDWLDGLFRPGQGEGGTAATGARSGGGGGGGVFHFDAVLALWGESSSIAQEGGGGGGGGGGSKDVIMIERRRRRCRSLLWLVRGALSRSPPVRSSTWSRLSDAVVALLVSIIGRPLLARAGATKNKIK